MRKQQWVKRSLAVPAIIWALSGCNVPKIMELTPKQKLPSSFANSTDSTNSGSQSWRNFFNDGNLQRLIDTAIANNQELMITLQDIEIARTVIRTRKGAILPTVAVGAGAGIEKVGRYTSQGASDAAHDIAPNHEMPDPLPDFSIGFTANWEVDIWKKLHNAKRAAIKRYLATIEGKNFVMTNLIAEVANTYYELLALDNQLAIVRQNIELQKSALNIVKVQKDAARVTELAVQKFEAEVLKTQSLEYVLLQRITESENRMSLLLGHYPQTVVRDHSDFLLQPPQMVTSGIPSQMLTNRPDIRQAELELTASGLDVKVARAEFYPSLNISATLGIRAFSPSFFTNFPESLVTSLAGELISPLINKNAIRAEFNKASAQQVQAMYEYERKLLSAYLEVSGQMSNIQNLGKTYELKTQQVQALSKSIDICSDLFRSGRADYLEVLMTQRDALDAKLELVETKKSQLNAVVNIYCSLGGGWK